MHSRPKTGQLHAVEKYLYHTGSITRPVHCHAQNWHSVKRIMQNAQSRNTAESSIRQMQQYGRSKPYTAESSISQTKSMQYTSSQIRHKDA